MSKDRKLLAFGRNTVWRNKFDNDFHNHTLKQLRKRFGGHFETDHGKNRYFPFLGVDRKDDDSGCHNARENALARLKELVIVNFALTDWKTPVQKRDMVWMNQYHPEVILGNLNITLIVSVIEVFFKESYVAILTYSPRKNEIIKPLQIRPFDLAKISEGTLRIEDAYANSLNFQNAKYICENFEKLDQNLCVRQGINKRAGRNREKYFEFIERLSSHRNAYIHHGEMLLDYDMKSSKNDAKFCETMIKSIYKNIAQKKNWIYEDPLF